MKFIALLALSIFLVSPSIAQEAIEEITPIYPSTPLCIDKSGSVLLEFKIDDTGSPYDISVIEAETRFFNRAAIYTLMKYKFKTGTYSLDETYSKTLEFKPRNTCQSRAVYNYSFEPTPYGAAQLRRYVLMR